MFCSKCGEEIANGAAFCNYCGEAQLTKNSQTQEKQPIQQAALQQRRIQQKPYVQQLVKKKRNGCLTAFLIVAAIFVGFILLGVILSAATGTQSTDTKVENTISTEAEAGKENDKGQADAAKKGKEKLTLEKFNKIETGMTYKEVVDIIGCEGTVEAETGIGGHEEYHTVSYRYMGKDVVSGSIGANASFMFQGGKLVTKAQAGLR